MISLAVSFGLVIAAVTSLGSLFVDSAVAAGLSAGTSGLILAAGSLTAVVVRIVLGSWSDTTHRDLLRTVGAMMALEPSASRSSPWFACPHSHRSRIVSAGMGLVRALHVCRDTEQHGAPATATGIVQTGAATGGVLGPVSIGYVAEHGDMRRRGGSHVY